MHIIKLIANPNEYLELLHMRIHRLNRVHTGFGPYARGNEQVAVLLLIMRGSRNRLW